MQIQLGVFVSEPWLVTVLALVAVAGDALLPFLPSGSLVIAAALLSLDHSGAPVALAVAVAAASFLGDLFVVALARGGSSRAHALFARHAGLASFAGRMRRQLARRLPSVTVAGRFVPAGRTVLGLTLGARPGQRARYLGWSAFGGLVWACYLVGLGVMNGMWFETRWIGFAMSTAVAVTLSTCLARSLRRRVDAEMSQAMSQAMSSQVGHLRDSPGEVRADEPGGTRPAACVVAQDHALGSALGPHRGHEAVRPHRRATENPVGSDPPLPSAHTRTATRTTSSSVTRRHLADVWHVEERAELEATARDRGFLSLDEAEETARRFVTLHRDRW
ncbi:DedA family protein [Streptomyces sp. NPDC097107]|uniref:DedA family protein n=1 Tax=Streptomyces sp. NPDC097107 TaxID=3366089 RepID=UPI0037F285BE